MGLSWLLALVEEVRSLDKEMIFYAPERWKVEEAGDRAPAADVILAAWMTSRDDLCGNWESSAISTNGIETANERYLAPPQNTCCYLFSRRPERPLQSFLMLLPMLRLFLVSLFVV